MMRNACAALIVIALWVVCCSPRANAAPPAPTPAINELYFSWDTREFSVDDAVALIDAHPKVALHRARIVDRLGFHGINPRLLPVLMDLGDSLIAVPAMSGTAANFVAAGTGPLTGLLSSSSGVAAYLLGCR